MKDHDEKHRTKIVRKCSIPLKKNTSVIQLEKFGKRSITHRPRHLNIKYHIITLKLNN